jgi:hypothetical protein
LTLEVAEVALLADTATVPGCGCAPSNGGLWEDRPMRRLLKLIALLLPLGWIFLFAWTFRFFAVQDSYIALRDEYYQMRDTHSDRSSTGDNLQVVYGNMQDEQREYLLALQDLTVLAILPAFFVYFLISLSTLRSRR